MNPSTVSPSIMEAKKRLLKVALIGAPNAGKSTLLNRLIMSDVSCVSNKVHTTRKNILGSYTEGDAQLEFYDSPGVITREHLLKHRLEDSLFKDPIDASNRCDLIAAVVDASNEREVRKLNRGLLSILNNNMDKKSYLILNKVDLVKDKRKLLDIGSLLSEGHLENSCINRQALLEVEKARRVFQEIPIKIRSKHVIELDSKREVQREEDREMAIGFRNFSQVFSISALQDDGVDELREHMFDLAKPIDRWPHGPDHLSDQSGKDITHAAIRGRVMDYVDHQIPYLIKYKYQEYRYDEFGGLHIQLDLVAPQKYMAGKLLGHQGATIFKIINESRDIISRVLACDVKLSITVKVKGN